MFCRSLGMPSGKPLTDIGKGKILTLYHENYSKRAIGRMLNHSECVIRSFLKFTSTYGTKKARDDLKNCLPETSGG